MPYDKSLFQYDIGSLGDSVLLFEKAYGHWIRADVSIFTHKKGLICVEIKNKHDTLKRLPKELKGYRLIANYIYVYTASNHLKGVEKIVKDLHMESYTGIIEYSVFNGVVIPGLVKGAKCNPNFQIKCLLWVIWYDELIRVLITNYGHLTYQPSNEGLSYHQLHKAMKSFFRYKHPRKRDVVNTFADAFSKERCIRLICDMFIYDDQDSEKPLNKSLFKEVGHE